VNCDYDNGNAIPLAKFAKNAKDGRRGRD